MTYDLFQRTFHNYRERRIKEALDAIERMPETELLNPNLAGKLEKIADNCCFEVASLRPGERRGKHGKEIRSVTDYGRSVDVSVDLIEVTIPFNGPAESLTFSPSTCTEIGRNVFAGDDGYLTARFDDDEQLDRNVDIVVERVSRNLDQLRKEMDQFRAELVSVLGKAADERAAEIKARKERDKTRSFPID